MAVGVAVGHGALTGDRDPGIGEPGVHTGAVHHGDDAVPEDDGGVPCPGADRGRARYPDLILSPGGAGLSGFRDPGPDRHCLGRVPISDPSASKQCSTSPWTVALTVRVNQVSMPSQAINVLVISEKTTVVPS